MMTVTKAAMTYTAETGERRARGDRLLSVSTLLWAVGGRPDGFRVAGGPGKDDIPSLTDPEFVPADKASFMGDSDMVLGVVIGGKAKAYPVKIMSWHEAVNDSSGPVKYLVTW